MSEHAAVELSPEAIQFAEFLASGENPPSEVDAARIQAEQVHLAAREPEGVTYREVDAGGVLGIWCEPVDANTDYVSWGTYEVLAGEDEEFAARVKDAGIDTTTVVVPGGQHSYVYGAGRIPETDAAIAQIGAWVREKTKI
jgi:hypothetical protein